MFRMIVVPIEGAVDVFNDNKYVYKNSLVAESQVKRNHQVVCFRLARECMADDIIIVYKGDNNDNISDLLTKSLPDWNCVQLRSQIMYS